MPSDSELERKYNDVLANEYPGCVSKTQMRKGLNHTNAVEADFRQEMKDLRDKVK